MNAFESLIAGLMEREGFWVRPSLKVRLTKEEKRRIGRPSSPRWEIDLVAYKPGMNLLRFIECKSYLDSRGVSARSFNENGLHGASRFKLFKDATLRDIVLQRAVLDLVEQGYCLPNPTAVLCLATGKIQSQADEINLREMFNQNGWELLTDIWIREGLRSIEGDGYENSVASIVAKLLRWVPQ